MTSYALRGNVTIILGELVPDTFTGALHQCGKAMFGESNPQSKVWSETQRKRLIELSGPKYLEELSEMIETETEPPKCAAMEQLNKYLSENRDRMWYRQRLAAGRPIGSGLIEGGCKNVIGARLKLNSARWRRHRAERMGHLRCLQYSDLWDAYWRSRAA